MDRVIEILTIPVPLFILFVIPAFVWTILCLIKRNGLYSVNCWFCNGWTKVLFAERNSFYCPFCLQYNGFNEDGGYNKIIKEQFNASFNKSFCKVVEKSGSFSCNGLCAYCNYNQQLKLRELANFVPLNEKNYDVEVEHFRAHLEKSFKLCENCDKVLKKTIGKQNAWIFGNLQIKGLSLLNLKKSKRLICRKSVTMNFIRYSLILLSLIVLSRALNETVEQYMPGIFISYTELLSDWCHIVSDAPDNLPITWVGLILEIILLTWQPNPVLWKTNELLGWIILIITSLSTFCEDYFEIVTALQILFSIATIYSILINNSAGRIQPLKKQCTLKKLKRHAELCEDSDEEIFEDLLNSSSRSKKPMSEKSYKSGNNFNASCNQSLFQDSLFQNLQQNTAINNTFATYKSTKINSSNNEILNFKSKSSASPVFSVNVLSRPILSAPKLKNIFQNSSTSGDYWENNEVVFPAATDVTNENRSSSQSSGFVPRYKPVIPNLYNPLPTSRERLPCGNFQKASTSSEPTCHFTPMNCTNSRKNNVLFNSSHLTQQCSSNINQLYYKTDKMSILKQNMLPVQRNDISILNVENRLGNVNLQDFNVTNILHPPVLAGEPPVLVGEKPVISTLFKNLPGVSPQFYNFRPPRCLSLF